MTPGEQIAVTQLLAQIEKRIDDRFDSVDRSIERVHGRISSSERRASSEHDEVKAAVSGLSERVNGLESVVDKAKGAKVVGLVIAGFVGASASATAILAYLT